MTNSIRNFLRGIQAIVQELETTLVDTLASAAPWLGPIAPAYLAYQAMINVLGLPVWIAWVIALVIELLGISTINTAVQFWNYNQTRRSNDPSAPFWLAVAMAAFYLTVVLVVNVLLDQAAMLDKVAKFLLSSLSPVAAVTLSLRAQHSRRLLEVDLKKVEDKRERQERKLLKVAPKVTEKKSDKPETFRKWKTWRKVPDVERRKIAEMKMEEVVTTYGVEERTAYNWIRDAKELLKSEIASLRSQ
jgi:hypothetical protein